MHLRYLLRLISSRGEEVRGASKDGIPVQSYANVNSGRATTTATEGSEGFPGYEYQFVVKLQDLDLHALQRWLLNGDPMTAKLNAVPDVVGEEGFQLVFDGAMLSSINFYGDEIYFSINSKTLERRYLTRFR
jgi:hypothetical protein